MKKSVRVILAVLLVLALCGCGLAETVYVSISDAEGKLMTAHLPVEVSDLDGDGILSIADALTAAHETAYDGGAEAGFAVESTEYGLSMVKLWGIENGGSYGYYLNNASAMSLSDPVSDGDHVHAYAYQDLETWSDTYCYFDSLQVAGTVGTAANLTLTALVYDASWNLVSMPVEGAIITIDGVDTEIVTDAEGHAAILFTEPGEYMISARSEAMTLVPPVMIITVS